MIKYNLVSIALASYNGSKYIREQLDSILCQSYQNFELIICDDCSTDNTWQILEEYAKKDSRIKIYRNATNLGFKNNFEKVISLCSGEYLALSDQDDIWESHHLDILLKNIDDKSASVGNAHLIDSEGRLFDYLLSEGDKYYISGNNVDKLYAILCYRNPFFGSISLYRIHEFINVAFPIPDFVDYHDLWFASIACCLNGLDYTFQTLIKHRIHTSNESGVHCVTFKQQIFGTLFHDRTIFSEKRIKICDELLKRIPNASAVVKDAIINIKDYHTNRLLGNRFKTISFMKRNYKRIFSTNNYKQFIPRCIGILISG